VASDIGLPLEKGRGADQKAHERAHTATWKRAPGLGGSQNSVQVRADPEKHGGVSEASTSPIPRVQLWLCLSSTHCKSALRRCLGTRQPTTGFLRGAAPSVPLRAHRAGFGFSEPGSHQLVRWHARALCNTLLRRGQGRHQRTMGTTTAHDLHDKSHQRHPGAHLGYPEHSRQCAPRGWGHRGALVALHRRTWYLTAYYEPPLHPGHA